MGFQIVRSSRGYLVAVPGPQFVDESVVAECGSRQCALRYIAEHERRVETHRNQALAIITLCCVFASFAFSYLLDISQ